MFKGKTILERVDFNNYRLGDTLSYTHNNKEYIAKAGFITDGASIPRLFWALIGCPLRGKYVGSAIIHDATCTLWHLGVITRKEGDLLFLQMLKDNGVGFIKRNIMYLAVRSAELFGRKPTEEKKQMKQFIEIKED